MTSFGRWRNLPRPVVWRKWKSIRNCGTSPVQCSSISVPQWSEISPSKIVSVGQCCLTVCYNIASYVWETKRNVGENTKKPSVYKVMWQFLWLIKFGFSQWKQQQQQHSPYSVMFDGVSISHWEREVVPPGLRVSDQERSVLILTKQQLLLCFESLYLSEIPPERQNKMT